MIGPREHINTLELRAVINGVLSFQGVQATDSTVILGALTKGRSKPRLALLVLKFNSLVVAASFTPLLVYCLADLNPADEWLKVINTAPLERRAGSDCE